MTKREYSRFIRSSRTKSSVRAEAVDLLFRDALDGGPNKPEIMPLDFEDCRIDSTAGGNSTMAIWISIPSSSSEIFLSCLFPTFCLAAYWLTPSMRLSSRSENRRSNGKREIVAVS